MLKINLKKIFLNFITILIIFLADRVSKLYILKIAELENKVDIYITSYLNLYLIWNKGIAFGLLSFKEDFFYEVVTILIIIVSLLVLWFALRTKGIEKFGFLMILGGALGNLFDRMYYSSVIDFIDISYNNYHWFIFNVADIFITLGVVMLISLELLKTKKKIFDI